MALPDIFVTNCNYRESICDQTQRKMPSERADESVQVIDYKWKCFGGLTRNRTGVQGFAVLCVTTPPRGHPEGIAKSLGRPLGCSNIDPRLLRQAVSDARMKNLREIHTERPLPEKAASFPAGRALHAWPSTHPSGGNQSSGSRSDGVCGRVRLSRENV